MCQFQHHGQLHSVIFLRAAFLKLPVQSNHKSFDECIYISASWKVLIWHTHPQNARGNKHTWGRSLISSRSKIITALTGLSSPHLTPLPLQFLICCDMWIRRCRVCIFRAEASFLFAVTRSRNRRDDDLLTTLHPKALISAVWHLHREGCAISTMRSAGQLGFVSRAPDWWMNHFFSSPSLQTHWFQRLDCGGHQIETGCEGRRVQTQRCHEYMRSLFGEKHVAGKEKCIYDGSVQRCVSLRLMQVCGRHLKKYDNLTLQHLFLSSLLFLIVLLIVFNEDLEVITPHFSFIVAHDSLAHCDSVLWCDP